MRNGSRRVYYSHGAAEHMDALAFFGPEHVVAEITSSWDDGRWDDDDDFEWWLDDAWADGGCCVDLDRRHLILYGGDGVMCDALWLETYLRLLPYTWPGWTFEWSWGELTQIARYARVGRDGLDRMRSGYREQIHVDHARYARTLLNVGKGRFASSTISAARDGRVGAAFTNEGWPEVMLELEGDIGRVVEDLPTEGLVYDCDEFLLGGLHLDFDRREVRIWRMWGTNNALEPPAHWSDWKIVDFGHRYREFYSSTPSFIEFVPRSEDSYLRKIGDQVCNERWGDSPDGLDASKRSTIFEEVVRRYRADNPVPRMLPEL